MKIRRILATAVAVAVTAPAVLLSVTPAFADAKPAARTQAKPTVEELEKAAAEAQKAYDKALAAKTAAYEVVKEALSDTAPLAVAAKAAKTAADEAGAAKTAADQAVTDAKAALDALPESATQEERAAATTAVTEAEAAALTAATAKTAADTKAKEAGDASDDARVAAARAYSLVQKDLADALAAKTAADEALAKAREEANEGQDCVAAPGLTTVLTGVPDSITAGTTTALSLRVSNRTDKAMDDVLAYANVHATDTSGLKETDKLLRLQWSTASSPKWHNVGGDHHINGLGPLKAGTHTDVKLRLTVDATAPAGNGAVFVTADYTNENGSCGGNPDIIAYDFGVKAAKPKPGKTGDTDPDPGTTGTGGTGGTGGTDSSDGSGPNAQGTASNDPVTTGGSLAATGSSSTTPQLALASGAAVALGAAAMFVVRRRRTGSQV
ncbi:LAETG motif-containing sortase-dependent surface protein [Streptomyces sp. NPDC048669]|uniref:LAETG motif-containing sortase-dependent surface protein n=1 Tax=Streptomyces sp. NPDC048669 TaxID=3155267 RepID=UPI00342DDE32